MCEALGGVSEKTSGGSSGMTELTAGVFETSGWRTVAFQRRSKRKHIVSNEGGGKAAAEDSNDIEASMSDCSELLLSQMGLNTQFKYAERKHFIQQNDNYYHYYFLPKTKGLKRG